MQYVQPFDQPSLPNASYINGNPDTGVAGSIPPAGALEYPQREIVSVLTASGQTPSNSDLQQLLRAIRDGVIGYYQDAGTVNHLVVAPSPTFPAMAAGNKFRIKTANAPTAGADLQVNTLSPVGIRKSGGATLTGSEWAAGDIITLEFDGTFAQLTSSAGGGSSGILITSNTTLSVPSQYATIQAALKASGRFIISPDVYVTISCASGYIENLTAITGPLYVSHPFGQRIKITGPALTGSFPVKSDVDGKTKAQVLSMLQGKFNVTINAVGTDAFQLHAGGLNLLQNILVVCDSTAGKFGIKVGDWQNEVGTGVIGVQNCWVHGAGSNGFEAQFLGVAQLINFGATYSGGANLRSAHGCNVECNFGGLILMYGATGVICANDGQVSIDSSSGTINIERNTVDGIDCSASGKFNAYPATGLNIKNNGGWGVSGFGDGLINLPTTVSFSGNGSGDITVDLISLCAAPGATVGTTSPARNTTGNRGSYIAI